MIKFVLHPGYIKSFNDGDIHYINASKLARLYNVKINECIICDRERPETFRGIRGNFAELEHLYPDYSGKYALIR